MHVKIGVHPVVLWLSVLLELILDVNSQSVGDNCIDRSTNRPGSCTVLIDCPSALADLQQRGIFPQICGNSGTVPIVCCPGTSTQTSIPSVVTRGRRVGEISRQKCKEYAKAIYTKKRNPTLLFGHDDTEIDEEDCRIIVKTLIVGGDNASEAEFPHMAAVGYDGRDPYGRSEKRWDCGGSLISEQYVLTAGHCLFSREIDVPKYVRIGVTNIHDTKFRQEFNIIERIKHPDYHPPSHYNDIALLKLDRPVVFKPQVRPACLYTEQEITHSKAIASGWGRVDYAGEGSENLLKVVLEFIDINSCNNSYISQIGRKLRRGIVDDIQVCAGSYSERRDTCQGDSGGPLQISNTGDSDIFCTYSVVGVTSFGKPCGIVNSPGIYTRVSSHLKWIEDIVWPE